MKVVDSVEKRERRGGIVWFSCTEGVREVLEGSGGVVPFVEEGDDAGEQGTAEGRRGRGGEGEGGGGHGGARGGAR